MTVRTLNVSTFSCAFSPDGRLLATQGEGDTVHLWNVNTGQEVRTLSGPHKYAAGVAFSPDGSLLACGAPDLSIDLWDTHTWRLKRTLDGRSLKAHMGSINTLAFSPNGRVLAMGGQDALVVVWDATAGRVLRTFKDAYGTISAVAFSPDGKYLVAGDMDETSNENGDSNNAGATVWDTATWQIARTFADHNTGMVTSIAISPDNTLLATAAFGKSFSLWAMPKKGDSSTR